MQTTFTIFCLVRGRHVHLPLDRYRVVNIISLSLSLALSLSLFLSLSLSLFPSYTHIHSCTSCIGASRCEWCPFSFQCIQPGRTCTTSESTVINGGVCPQIFPSSATGEYLVHVNYDYQQTPLRINSSDLTQFRNDFENDRFT